MNAKLIFILIATALIAGCTQSQSVQIDSLKSSAKAYFSGMYGGNPSVIADLAAEDIQISYPIFQELFDSPVIEGNQAVKDFAKRFAQKWKNPKFSFNQVIAEENTVVLLWSFSATDPTKNSEGNTLGGGRTSWGGITIIQFNEQGKISREIGEESSPGPCARISDTH